MLVLKQLAVCKHVSYVMREVFAAAPVLQLSCTFLTRVRTCPAPPLSVVADHCHVALFYAGFGHHLDSCQPSMGGAAAVPLERDQQVKHMYTLFTEMSPAQSDRSSRPHQPYFGAGN